MIRISVLMFVLLAVPGLLEAQSNPDGATATGISRDFNPAISLNTLFLTSGFAGLQEGDAEEDEALESGLRHQESEFQFTSTIDAYSSADLIFTFEDGQFDLEEGYVTSNVLPRGLGLRAGQMFVPVGRENKLHSHQLPFIQRSLFASQVFGEALSEFGVELSYLTPLDWYLEFRGAAYNGDNESLFNGAGDWDLAYLGGAKALWDVGDEATFSLGGDYLAGPNSSGGEGSAEWSQLLSGVMRYKWRSASQSDYKSLDLLAEFLYAAREAETAAERFFDRGAYGYASLQLARRWWVEGRYDYYNPDHEDSSQRGSFLLAFVPTEYSALRFQTSIVSTPEDDFTEFLLQYNFTIGSHPAHQY